MCSIEVYRINTYKIEGNKVDTIYCDYTKEEIVDTLLRIGWARTGLDGYIKNGFYLSVKKITPVKDLTASLSFI